MAVGNAHATKQMVVTSGKPIGPMPFDNAWNCGKGAIAANAGTRNIMAFL